jgi:non-heme chloroperoxidase
VGLTGPSSTIPSLSTPPTVRRLSRRTWTGTTTSISSAGAGSATKRGKNSFRVAIRVSAAAALGCAVAWREDFRADVARITIPVQIVQGDQDRIMPPETTGNHLVLMLADARLTVIPEGGHAIIWTHAAEVNRALVGFVRAL